MRLSVTACELISCAPSRRQCLGKMSDGGDATPANPRSKPRLLAPSAGRQRRYFGAAVLSRDVMQDLTSATNSSSDWPRMPLAATCTSNSDPLPAVLMLTSL